MNGCAGSRTSGIIVPEVKRPQMPAVDYSCMSDKDLGKLTKFFIETLGALKKHEANARIINEN